MLTHPPEPSRLQIRRRRRRLQIRHQCRPTRAAAQARHGDNGRRKRPLHLQKPPRHIRVPTLPDSAPERRLVPRPHAGPQAPNEPRTTSSARGARRQEPGPLVSARCCGRASQETAHQDRPAGIQNHQDLGPSDAPAGSAIPAAVPGDHSGHYAPCALHVGF